MAGERVTSRGIAMLLCPFHREKTPSLRVWPHGRFICYGCLCEGDLTDYPEVAARYLHVKMSTLPGQLKFDFDAVCSVGTADASTCSSDGGKTAS